jgi:Flp pilus assembly protein TadG
MGACRNKLREERGVIFILFIVVLLVLLAFAALALDVGNVMVVKNELQNISDGAALAAARKLGDIYEKLPYQAQASYNVTNDADTIKDVANQVAILNKAEAAPMTIDTVNDVKIGRWDTQNKNFTENPMQPDAVWVKARKDGTLNNPVATFFARIFGMNTVDVSATAIAALTGQSTADEGGLPVPLGISRHWFDLEGVNNFCNQPIRFYPTNDPSSCAGWHVYNRYDNAPDSRLGQTITDLENKTYESPETTAYQIQFEFTGGTMSTQTFAAMKSLFLASLNYKTDPNLTANDAWLAAVPVYDSSDCSNPHGAITITGFAKIVITGVLDSPVHQIDGYVVCHSYEPGRGNGGNYGTKGTIPGLVQ